MLNYTQFESQGSWCTSPCHTQGKQLKLNEHKEANYELQYTKYVL
jgi:hypothetical protein